jgi:hypothetical protein
MELRTTLEATNYVATWYFPAFYGTRRFITAFTRALHLSLSWARPIQPTPPQPISKRPILILSVYLRLGLPSGLFPSGFPTNNLYAFLFSPIRDTCPAHLYIKNTQLYVYNIQLILSWKLCLPSLSAHPCSLVPMLLLSVSPCRGILPRFYVQSQFSGHELCVLYLWIPSSLVLRESIRSLRSTIKSCSYWDLYHDDPLKGKLKRRWVRVTVAI